MQTVTLSLTKDTWTQVPVVSGVNINHREGGTVAYAIADTVPSGFSPTSPILGTSRFGESRTVDGFGSILWAYAISTDAVIAVTELKTSASTVVKYDGLATPISSVSSKSQSEFFNFLGLSFVHQYVLDFTSNNEIKYLMYTFPTTASGRFLAVQERLLKTFNGAVEISILAGSVGASMASVPEVPRKNNNMSSNEPSMRTSNLTDSDGTEPSDDGTVIEVDFVTESGSGSNTSGTLSTQSGLKIFPPDGSVIVKVQNLHNGSNRVLFSYTWFEIPTDYI